MSGEFKNGGKVRPKICILNNLAAFAQVLAFSHVQMSSLKHVRPTTGPGVQG